MSESIRLALKKLPKPWSYSGSSGAEWVSVSPHDVSSIEDVTTSLYQWAVEYKIGLEPRKTSLFSGYDFDGEFWSGYSLREDFAITEKFFGDGRSNVNGIEERNGAFVCQHCYRRGLKVVSVKRLTGSFTQLCVLCYTPCDRCAKPVYVAELPKDTLEEGVLCTECQPVFRCGACSRYKRKDGSEKVLTIHARQGVPLKADVVTCSACQEARTCGGCDKLFDRTTKFVDYEGVKCCPVCHEEKVSKDFEKFEKFRLEELPKGGLIIKSLPARPVRTVSIETEVDGDKNVLANTLYKCGVVRVPEVERYGTATPDQSKWAAFLKHDGSVTGGELISFMLSLDNKEHSEAFKVTLRKLRALEKSRYIEFNPNCGGHIHIDAHGFGTENVWRLLTIWNYLEDFTYRLAGAGHSYGHRTLVQGHDRANGGRGYANPTVKGPWGIKSSVGQAVRQQDRMCGLNFQPYLGAIRYCDCGAVQADNMRSCTCSLPKCTIEWRVWNSQRNPRILHAWIAYMQAVHAYADVDDEPNAAFERQFPALGWTRKPWDKLEQKQKNAVFDRIDWCFNNLVFTPEERDSLVYSIKQSEIKLSQDDEKRLLSIKGPSTLAPIRKAIRKSKVNTRQHKIVIEAPKPGDNPFKEAQRRAERLINRW